MADTTATQVDGQLNEDQQPTQVAYRPHSQGRSIETVCPPTMATPMSISLDRVEAVTGQSVDEFVAGRLGIDQETLFSRYAAEQIDCLSIAYLNQDRGRPTLIANDTGTGKGRIVSGVIAPVLSSSESEMGASKIAVFITAKPDLYVDMLARDMVDTGVREQIRPFFTNNSLDLELTSPSGEVTGNIKTAATQQHTAEIQELINQFRETGTLGEYNCIFTTYDQLSQKGSQRRELLETIAPSATFVLDECDLGGGASGPEPKPSRKEVERWGKGEDIRSISQFLTGSVLPQSDSYVLLSATAFKDPFVLSRLLYPKSEIQETGLEKEALAEKLVAQGIPGQQDFTNKLALAGELVRLEKSMEGITFQTEAVPVDLEMVDAASRVMAKLVEFDRAKQNAVDAIRQEYAGEGSAIQASDGSSGRPAVDSTNFTSTAYNFQQQFLFFLKADSIAQRTIESIESGRKPEIIFFNTMQAVIEEQLANQREDIEREVLQELQQANPDEQVSEAQLEQTTRERYQEWLHSSPTPEITLDVGGLLERQLDKCRMVTIKDAYGDRTRHYLSDEELGYEASALDNEIRLRCQNRDWSSVKISGVDSILQQVSEAGYTIAEMSGRSVGIDYSDGTPRFREVDAADRDVRAAAKNGYNNGENDALIANITTGWSGHASRSVNDQRQREAILAQAHPDGNKLMQSLGRVNRVGQVDPSKHEPDWTDAEGNPGWGQVREQHGIPGSFGLPVMTMLYADGVAYEERITANINRKMASLNANTTGSRSSGVQLGDVDFMNSYGDQVAWDLMMDDPELNAKLDFPISTKDDLEGAMQKVTGRSLLLPLDEQRQLFDDLKQNFVEYIAQREAIGESPMESKTLDLQAKTIGRVELAPSSSDSLFAGATFVEVVQAKSLRKPHSSLTVANQIRKSVGMEAVEALTPGEFTPEGQPRSLGQAAMASLVGGLEEQIAAQQAQLDEKIAQLAEIRQEKEPPIRARIDELQGQMHGLLTAETPDNKAIQKLQKSLKSEQRSLSKLLLDTNPNNETHMQAKLADQLKFTKERLELCPMGQPVRIYDKELGAVSGIVTGIQRVKGVKNLVAGGAWKVKFAIADGAREMTLKLSDINTEKKCWVDQVETATQYQPPFERVPVHQQFDEMQRATFETRQIVTGNLLSSPVGKKYINFTNNQGQVRQGLLLPRGYDIEQAMERMPVVLKTRAQQQEFLAQVPGAKLLTTDEVLRIADTAIPVKPGTASLPGLLVEIQSSKRGGGKYFKDPELMALTERGEFEKSGQVMRGYIRSEQREAFLEVLERKFPGQKLAVFADAFKPIARDITGESLQDMDWFREDQPLDLAAQELEISTEGVAARIADQGEQTRAKAQQEQQKQALQAGDLDAAQPAGEAQIREMSHHPDLEKLTQGFEAHFSSGGGFERITEARKFAIAMLQRDGSDLDLTLTNKQVDECVEKSLVRVAREIVQTTDPLESFDQLVELYDRQPNLSSRTSTSIIHQQYSTPLPIGRLVQQLGDITPETTVYEPTAGNGSLLSNADPNRAIVNELDPRRARELQAQGFEVTTQDAAVYAPEQKSVERVILNPPFGAVTDPETQQTKRWLIELDNPAEGTRPYETSAVDHAISFKALSAMQDDGKAVLVLGAPMEQKMGAEANAAYNEGQTRSFFYTLYNNYNVTDHFTIAGDLYQKQGTSFPIDVVVIDGRGKSDLELPAVKPPPVYRTWDELRQVMESVAPQQVKVSSVQHQQGEAMKTQPPEAIQEILSAKEQKGSAERNVAKLLHQLGLAEAIAHAPDKEFHLRIENEPYMPLVVERHGEDLYLTHYREQNGDTFIDAELVLKLREDGKLQFQETATLNPFSGGEHRAPDRGFAQTFSRNLLDQGFAEAATLALTEKTAQVELHQQQTQQASEEQPETQTDAATDPELLPLAPNATNGTDLEPAIQAPEPVESDPLNFLNESVGEQNDHSGGRTTLEVEKSASPVPEKALAITQQVIQQRDPATATKLSASEDPQSCSPSLAALRTWFSSAKELGRDTSHVAEVAQAMLDGTPEARKPNSQRDPNYRNPGFTLPPDDLQAMKSDITDARVKRVLDGCKQILKGFGKPDPQNRDLIQFAKPQGDLVVGLDRQSQTLTAYSRHQDRTLLTAVAGKVQGEPEDVKYVEQRVTRFLEKSQQRKQTQNMEQ